MKIFLHQFYPFKNEVPLAIEDADIAPANELNIPFEILLSKTILIFSLSIFLGFNFCNVFFAAIVPIWSWLQDIIKMTSAGKLIISFHFIIRIFCNSNT